MYAAIGRPACRGLARHGAPEQPNETTRALPLVLLPNLPPGLKPGSTLRSAAVSIFHHVCRLLYPLGKNEKG